MALKSTIYKATLQVADMDRHYYADHQLNVACHPSETLERMMVRILAFALNAHEQLAFGKGISDADEPDLWQKDLTGAVEKWIAEVLVYPYAAGTPVWWKPLANKLTRAANLKVLAIDPADAASLGQLCERTMQLQVTVQDGEVWMRNDSREVQVRLSPLVA